MKKHYYSHLKYTLEHSKNKLSQQCQKASVYVDYMTTILTTNLTTFGLI